MNSGTPQQAVEIVPLIVCDEHSNSVDTLPEGMDFPMCVVRVGDFMDMQDHFVPKTHGKLVKSGKVLSWQPGMFCSFISHQWLAKSHPDPHAQQLTDLRLFFKGLTDNSITVRSGIFHDVVFQNPMVMGSGLRLQIIQGYMWYDWFSIPQIKVGDGQNSSGDMVKAVNSIPIYIEHCDVFLVLAPPNLHHDTGATCNFTSWRNRGWCRTEVACRILSRRDDSFNIIVISSGTQAKFLLAHGSLFTSAVDGDFTFASDRDIVKRVTTSSFDRKLRYYEEQGHEGLFHLRFLKSLRSFLLDGRKEFRKRNHKNESGFLRSYHFASFLDHGENGFGPIFIAAMEDNVTMLDCAFEAGANVNARITKDIPLYGFHIGYTPIMAALGFEHHDALENLLCAKADINGTVACAPALFFASSCQSIKSLVDHRADLHSVGANGVNVVLALIARAAYGSVGDTSPSLKLLLDLKANLDHVDNHGAGALLYQTVFTDDVACVGFLLECGLDPNQRVVAHNAVGKVVYAVTRTMRWFGVRSESVEVFSEMDGGTCLHVAVLMRHIDVCKRLLLARADTNIRNHRGNTPLDLMREFGHRELQAFATDGLNRINGPMA